MEKHSENKNSSFEHIYRFKDLYSREFHDDVLHSVGSLKLAKK